MKKLSSDDFYDIYEIEEDIEEGELNKELDYFIGQYRCTLELKDLIMCLLRPNEKDRLEAIQAL